jgi:hypothetical protein
VPVAIALAAVVLALTALPAFGQAYLARPQVVGGNPGPAHNYVCPNVDRGTALDCYLDALRHLYTMCRHVKGIEILEHGYEKSDEGTNTSKSEYCIDKQKSNIARPYQSALTELKTSKPATAALKDLHEFWLASLASLKWRPGESDDDYKFRTGVIYVDFYDRADMVREAAAVQSVPDKRQVAGKKAAR